MTSSSSQSLSQYLHRPITFGTILNTTPALCERHNRPQSSTCISESSKAVLKMLCVPLCRIVLYLSTTSNLDVTTSMVCGGCSYDLAAFWLVFHINAIAVQRTRNTQLLYWSRGKMRDSSECGWTWVERQSKT